MPVCCPCLPLWVFQTLCAPGESGLGKTTFINNLVSSYVTTGKTHDGSSTSLADFQVRLTVLLLLCNVPASAVISFH
jgi:septin family protein